MVHYRVNAHPHKNDLQWVLEPFLKTREAIYHRPQIGQVEQVFNYFNYEKASQGS
jgi:hypothetical protein